jgi:hypothetical protein
MPTFVSWGVEVTYNSLFMQTPVLLHRSKEAAVIGRIEEFSEISGTRPGISGIASGTHTIVKVQNSSALIASCTSSVL